MASGVGEFLTKKTADLPNWAWLAVVVIGGGVGFYFVRRQNAATSTASTPGSSASANALNTTDTPDASTYEVGNQPVSPDYSTSGMPSSPVYVIGAPASGTPPPTPPSTPPPTRTVTVRAKQTSGPNADYDKSHSGVPIHAGTSGQTPTLRLAPYGSQVQITGDAVIGASNTGSGQGGSDYWYPVVGGGYLSAWDVVGMGGGGGGSVRRETRVATPAG
jgi:hypothetical protein